MVKSASDLKSAREYMSRRRQAQREAKANAMVNGETYDVPTLLGVWLRDAGVCYLCGGSCFVPGCSRNEPKRPTMDHVIALSNGGLHNYANLRLCCFECNRAKSTALVEEYTGQLAAIGA
jgi:5-methylcytosine-specific restriction endonuclease McrA